MWDRKFTGLGNSHRSNVMFTGAKGNWLNWVDMPKKKVVVRKTALRGSPVYSGVKQPAAMH